MILARRALANPDGVKVLHRGTHSFIHQRTTSYRRANLTDAVFTDATTGLSDFTDANITGTTFEGASVTGRGKVSTERQLRVAMRTDPE